ncbi:MAG: hypothetical protein Q4C91_22530 [Eubacteriales bacterium]|nr:hypothetical protein [Eubacteriales bacterium]
MDIWEIVLKVIAWYSIIGTSIGVGLIAFYLYFKYKKKRSVKKLLAAGIMFIGVTVVIFLVFLFYGFTCLGLAQN